MPLPRGTKTSRHSAHTKSATRQASKNQRREINDEDEEMEDFDGTEAMDFEKDDGEDELAEEQKSDSAEQLICKMVDDARRRHAVKKKAVIQAYDTTAAQTQEALTELFDTHETKASEAHDAQLKRLAQLVDRKAQIEAALHARLASMRASYDAHSRDLESVLARKIKELDPKHVA